MGLTSLMVEVANPAWLNKTEQLQLLVNSGAIYSVVPARVLRRLGIRPLLAKSSDSPMAALFPATGAGPCLSMAAKSVSLR